MPKYKTKIENNNLEQIGKAVITSDRKIEFKRTGIKGLSNFIENNFYNSEKGILGGKFIYKVRCKDLDKICFKNVEGYLDSKILIKSEKEEIQFQNQMKYLSYTEKQNVFFNLLPSLKNVEINFDFKNKKFYFQDVTDENEKIRIVKRIKKILEKFLNFSGTDNLEKIIKIFELYLAKFESEKVDERIEMIKDFEI